MLKIMYPNKKISIKIIENFEKKFNIELPNDYKQFMLNHNGGTPEDDMLFYFNNKILSPLKVLEFSDISIIKSSLESCINNPKEDDAEIIKNKIIKICITSINCMLCIGVGEKNKGKIYIYDMEETTGKPFILISDSFTEFINSFEKEQ